MQLVRLYTCPVHVQQPERFAVLSHGTGILAEKQRKRKTEREEKIQAASASSSPVNIIESAARHPDLYFLGSQAVPST